MSTAELFLEPDEIDDFINDTLSDDLLHTIGDEEGPWYGLCPYISFYIYHTPDDYLPIADKMIAIYAAFSQLIDEPFQIIRNADTQDWLPAGDKRLPPLEALPAVARKMQAADREFWIRATDQESTATTARWAFNGEIGSGLMHYTTLKLTFRHKWYNRNKARWQAFVKDCLARLQPEHCYSGFEVGNGGFNVLGAYESDVLERICADYFYGMDIDHPGKMGFHSYWHKDGKSDGSDLGAGIRTPSWCFMLSPCLRAQLGKTEAEIRAELNDPRIEIAAIPYAVGPHNPNGEPGLWIRLGELDLHPVDKGVPDLLVKANRLIKPIRCDYLRLLTLDPWDDDPNPRFGYESSLRWMRRFDDDSDWPTPEKRRSGGSGLTSRPNIPAGQPCPETGWWYTPAQGNSRRYFKEGAVMPSVGGDYGDTFWQWAADQSTPSL